MHMDGNLMDAGVTKVLAHASDIQITGDCVVFETSPDFARLPSEDGYWLVLDSKQRLRIDLTAVGSRPSGGTFVKARLAW
jgi:hypothetical protein